MAVLLLITGWMTYTSAERLSDRNYAVTWNDWKTLSSYLDTLGSRDIIVSQRTDGTLLHNPYPFMNDGAFTAAAAPTLVPISHTHLLFDPYYPHEYSSTTLPDTVWAAQQAGLLEGKDRLIFFSTRWAISHITGLAQCATLNKEVVTFPSLKPMQSLTPNANVSAVIVIVSKSTFLDEFLAPGGKAHFCLEAMRTRSLP
jgi:hypothetical protein